MRSDPRYEAFFAQNETFDLLGFPFLDADAVRALDWSGYEAEEELPVMMGWQRVLRTGASEALAGTLLERGYDSAHAIARLPEWQFVEAMQDAAPAEELRGVYRGAAQTKSRAQHLWANLHNTLFSPFYRSTRFANFAEIDVSGGSLPTYQDLFGSLSYAFCPHCRSIFGPAAYFVDIMRVTREYITAKNTIPAGWKLDERRPDLGNILLTCANTDTVIDYLQVVNDVLGARLSVEWQVADVYRSLATEPYPVALPFNLPLVQMRTYLGAIQSSLAAVYGALAAPPGTTPVADVPTPFEIAREQLSLSPEQYAIVSTPAGTSDALAKLYGVTTRQLLPSVITPTGTVTVVKDQVTVAGTNTLFTNIRIGDQVQIGADIRTVIDVTSDTAMMVDGPWANSASGVNYLIYPLDNLQTAVFFTYHTSMDWASLTLLIEQHLSDDEMAAGIAGQFFINQGSPQPLRLVVAASDPYAAVRIITPFDNASLDRVNRFLRLANWSGISYPDLDWVMTVSGITAIDEAAIEKIAAIAQLAQQFRIPIDQVTALFSDIKTIGVGHLAEPLDLFDRLFNSPTILGVSRGQSPAFTAKGTVTVVRGSSTVTGSPDTIFDKQVTAGERVRVKDEVHAVLTVDEHSLTIVGTWGIDAAGAPLVVIPDPALSDEAVPVYHPLYADNPLYTNPVLEWDVAKSTAQASMRQRLVAALRVSDDDLTLIALHILGPNPPSTILSLTVENLSLLYSFARMAALLNMPVRDFFTLLGLLGVTRFRSTADIQLVTSYAVWLKTSGINVYTLSYILTGSGSDYYKPSYSPAAVPGFLRTLWVLAQTVMLYPSSFVSADIDELLSASFYEQLVEGGWATEHGAVLTKPLAWADVASMNPLKDTSFVTPDITVDESRRVYTELQATQPPVLLADGSLSVTFTSSTPLDFLFPDDPIKVSQVRAVLVTVHNGIDSVLSTVPKHAEQQRQTLNEQTAVFLGGDVATVTLLMLFVAETLSKPDYVALFLQPYNEENLPDVLAFLASTSRALVATQVVPLSAGETAQVVAHPEYFAVGSLATPTIDGIRNLTTFRELERHFNDTTGQLLRYFQTPPDNTECALSAKTAILAGLTHWEPAQICAIIDTYWPGSMGYNNVVGVQFMKSLFDFASRLGVDVFTLFSQATVASIRTIDDATWQAYNAAASSWLSIVSARFDPEGWRPIYGDITDSLNTARRDALAGAAIFTLQKTFPSIQTTSDLYDFFLIDVEMGGCGRTSLIAQGIASVQLYMQRTRMMLEPGVTDLSAIPEIWWSWLTTYRLWEVNRKIFLYPENYIDPSVSDYSTPLFTKLKDNLTANEVTEASVTAAYVEYFDQFTKLAALRFVDSFYGPLADPDTGVVYDTLVVIGRTAATPYKYYWRTWTPATGLPWSPWKEIELTITAPAVSPIVILNRLYLFWTELDSNSVSSFSNNANANAIATRTRLQYSFINSAREWVPPQPLDDIVAGYNPPGYSTAYVNPASFDFSEPQWGRPIVYPIKGTTIANWTMVLLYGGYYLLPTGTPTPPPAPAPTPQWTAEQTAMAQRSYDSTQAAIASSGAGETGFTFVQEAYVIDTLLTAVETNMSSLKYDTVTGVPNPSFVYRSNTAAELRFGPCATIYLVPYFSSRATDVAVTSYPLLYNVAASGWTVRATASQPGWVLYDNGDETFLLRSQQPGLKQLVDATRLRQGTTAASYGTRSSLLGLKWADDVPMSSVQFKFSRLTTGAITRMQQALFAGGVSLLLSPATQRTPAVPLYPFSRFYSGGTPPANTIPPDINDGDTIDYLGPYGTYLWEVFFQIPFLVANQLRANRRFDEAKHWYEYIFNPTAAPDGTEQHPNDRYWQFLFFRGLSIPSVAEDLSDPQQIARYNDDPFDPDAIALLRPSAYQKAIVMRYIDNLLDWGDSLFALDTAESINQATLLYVVARDLLGPRPTNLGNLDEEEPATFNDIVAKYGDDIPQFLIRLEQTLPAMPTPVVQSTDPYVPFNDLHTYFCVPENSEFIGYWDRVEDRLNKIRNCMNLAGEERELALFAPPLDPRAVIRAASSGQGGPSVTSQAKPIFPPYRFSFVIGLAKDLVGQLTQLGGSLLSALEKLDAERLALMRQTQEMRILEMTTRVREKQIEELRYTRASLEVSRTSAQTRAAFYQGLYDQGLSPAEVLNLVMTVVSGALSTTSGVIRAVAAGLHLVPNVGSPFAMTYGGRQLGPSVDAASAALDAASTYANLFATVSMTTAGYERRAQEWQFQATIANFDVQQIADQIAAVDAQIASAERQLEIHLQQMVQAADLEAFLRSRFTNEELYSWMIARISVVFFQTYLVALDTALSAQLAFQYELSVDDTYITFDYWDSLKRGLLSGEQLMLGLDQMQSAYVQGNVRALEITKSVSLYQLDPRALLDLRNRGTCEFDLNEALYDYDFPGHYNRKIKTISISIPALVGPYQNVKATLTQKGNVVLVKPDPNAVKTLLGITSTVPPAGVLRTNWRANQKIAISTGINDSGLFEVNLNDDRYLPFEGTGAVSSWRLELPMYANLIDFDTISDVVITVRYTAFDAGAKFRADVIAQLETLTDRFMRPILAANEFPTQWYAFMHPPAAAPSQTLTFTLAPRTFPANLSDLKLTGIYAQPVLAEGVRLGGTFSTVLTIGSAQPIALDFTDTSNPNLTNLALTQFIGVPWTLDVPLNANNPPSGIRSGTTIDPSKLLSISFIATYTAKRNWS